MSRTLTKCTIDVQPLRITVKFGMSTKYVAYVIVTLSTMSVNCLGQ